MRAPVHSRGLVRRSVGLLHDTMSQSVAQCHGRLTTPADRPDREAAASARDSGGVKLVSEEVEACRQVVGSNSMKRSS